MIERIQNKKGNYLPCKEVIEILHNMKEEDRRDISVAEIGVDIGATACSILEILEEEDTYYMFDLDYKINELYEDFLKASFVKAKVIPCANTTRRFDCYSWSLMKLYKERGKEAFLDLVYLDGAHTFFHDAPTVCMLKKLIKKGGILVLDDMDWSFAVSPTCNPKVNPSVLEQYTEEQIETAQIAIVADMFLTDDPEWLEDIERRSSHRRTYRRV